MDGMSMHDYCSSAIVAIHIVMTAHTHNMCAFLLEENRKRIDRVSSIRAS